MNQKEMTDFILSQCSHSAAKLIIGPSTPLSPALFELGFDYIAGIVVKDKDLVRQGIENGLAFKQLQGVKYVILRANHEIILPQLRKS